MYIKTIRIKQLVISKREREELLNLLQQADGHYRPETYGVLDNGDRVMVKLMEPAPPSRIKLEKEYGLSKAFDYGDKL